MSSRNFDVVQRNENPYYGKSSQYQTRKNEIKKKEMNSSLTSQEGHDVLQCSENAYYGVESHRTGPLRASNIVQSAENQYYDAS